MVQLSPVPVFRCEKKKYQYHLTEIFTEIFVQMISAPCNIPVTQRLSLTNLRYL